MAHARRGGGGARAMRARVTRIYSRIQYTCSGHACRSRRARAAPGGPSSAVVVTGIASLAEGFVHSFGCVAVAADIALKLSILAYAGSRASAHARLLDPTAR